MAERFFNTPARALAYYTECQLATLEGLKCKKSTSKSELRRQQSIADGVVEHCRAFVTASDIDNVNAIRLRELVTVGSSEGGQAAPEILETLKRVLQRCSGLDPFTAKEAEAVIAKAEGKEGGR